MEIAKDNIEIYYYGQYESFKAYIILKSISIIPIIKPKKNARIDRGPPERRNSVTIFKNLDENGVK